MKTILITLIIILANLNINAQLSGTYIVGGPNGDYPNPSLAIQTLVQQGVSGPVVFEIYSGSYYVKEAIPPIVGTSLHNTVTFISQTQNADDVEFYNTTNDNASSYIILLKGGQNIIFKNIEFCQKGTTSGCIRLSNMSGNIFLYSNLFSAPYYNKNTSVNSLFGVNNSSVINLSGSFVLDDNTFKNGARAVRLASLQRIDKVEIVNNRISQCYAGVAISNVDSVSFVNSITICEQDAVSLGTISVVEFSNNRVESILDYSFGLAGTQSSKVFNNIMLSYSKSKPSIYISNTSYSSLYNNTILSNSIGLNVTSVEINSNTNLNFKNNILINDSSAYLAAIRGNSNSNFDYNVYYTANDTIFNDGYGIIHTSLASWQAATGYDAHSIFVKPNFSKPNDLHLQANNPQIIGAGTPLTLVPRDIDGENRDAVHPDIGADEYSLRPIIDSVVWGCAGSVVILDAGAGFSSYLWSNNASTQTITVDTNGLGLSQVLYSVTVGYGGNSSSATTKVIWQDCTSLLHYQKEDINVKIFPNPTNGIVNIEIPDKIRDFEVRVYNSNGSLLMSKRNQKRINLSRNAKGLYFIQILTDESLVMRKVILK